MPDQHRSRQTYLTLIQIDNRLGKFNYEDEVLGHHYFIARDPRAIQAVHQIYKDGIRNGKTGKLSDNKLRDAKNLFVVSVTLVTRYCIEAGMYQDLAFTLSDLWIRHIENINSVDMLVEEQCRMVTEFFERLCSFKYVKSQNPYVTQAINYIVQNLDQNLNAKTVSSAVHLSASHLTKLFDTKN